MTEMNNSLSYTQDQAERLFDNLFAMSDIQLKFKSTYGFGNTPDEFSLNKKSWNDHKEDLYEEYDDLWKELATR